MMLKPLTRICQQRRLYRMNSWIETNFDNHLAHTKPNPELWRKVTLFGALPIVLLASINMYLIEKKHAEHEPEEIIILEADYMGKLTRKYPWRDGTKPLFYNPKFKRMHLTFVFVIICGRGSRAMYTYQLGCFKMFADFLSNVTCSRVLEIGEGFFERNLTETGEKWFVMFYVPWCHYCKRFDPIWSNIAQDAYAYPHKVHMAKFDCNQYKDACDKYKIHAYPTFIFFKNNQTYKYNSEMSRKEVFYFARRLAESSPIVSINTSSQLDEIKRTNPVFFMYIGAKNDSLWPNYSHVATDYHGETSFYAVDDAQFENLTKSDNAVLVSYKSEKYYYYDDAKPLVEWIDEERFELFQRVTENSFHQIAKSRKLLVFVVVKENEINQLTGEMEFFKQFMESLVLEHRDQYYKLYQFCWVTNPIWIQKILMHAPRLPYFFVMNSTSYRYHIPDKDVNEMTPEEINEFFEQVHNELVPTYGGKTLPYRIYRFAYISAVTVHQMWKGNPVLTSVIFGVPLMYLLLILYTGFCPDFFEDNTDDDTEEAKKNQ